MIALLKCTGHYDEDLRELTLVLVLTFILFYGTSFYFVTFTTPESVSVEVFTCVYWLVARKVDDAYFDKRLAFFDTSSVDRGQYKF